ncbi:MAG: septum formation initiator family protein [Acidimicrobiia bacterium]|nr:septum formation initiator family protein [Acidimicrobiia bacterium]
MILLGLGLVASIPARQIIEQREESAAAERRVAALDVEIARLQARATDLDEPEHLKQLAHANLGLVEPGQESYRITFPAAGPVPVPRGWPFLLPEAGG